MHAADKAILVVFAWPETASDAARSKAIQAITGVDAYEANLQVRRAGVPQIIGVIDHERAIRAAGKLNKAGADAIAAPPRDVGAHACRDLAKRFIEGHDESGVTWLVETWGGEPRVIRAADLLVLVRGRFQLSAGSDITINNPAMRNASGYGVIGVGGIGGVGSMGVNEEPIVQRTHRKRLAEVLDIHLIDGDPLRVHGDKISFDVLGAGKGITDAENMDLLAAHMAEVAPHAAIDVDFQAFKPQAEGVRAFHVAAGKRGNPRVQTPPEFEFYSALMALKNLQHLRS